MWEAFEHAAYDGPRQPDRDHRRQPPRPARRDDARLGHRRLRAPGARRSAGTRSRSTATTSTQIDDALRGRRWPPTASPSRSSPARSRARASPRSRTRTAATASRSADPEAAIAELGGAARHGRDVPSRRPPTAEPHRFATGEAASGRAGRSARRSRRAGPTATRWPRSAPPTGGSSPSTARSATRPTPSCSARPIPSATSRCTSPSSRLVAAAVGMQVRGWVPFASTFAAFLSAPTTSSGWRRSAAPNIRLSARTPACRSARTARRRWRSRTSPRCGPSTAAPSSTRAARTRPRSSSRPWSIGPGIVYLRTTRARLPVLYAGRRGVPDRRRPGRALVRRRRGHAGRAPGSPCTRRSPRPRRWPARASRRA